MDIGQPELERYRRRLPHWRLEGSTYYITFKAKTVLTIDEIKLVLDHIVKGDIQFYTLIAVCVMPDHVHALLKPDRGFDLTRIMKGMKGASARLINQRRGRSGSVWQDESWDRIMRNQAELDEKLGYMLGNPLEAGLVENPWEWVGWFVTRNVV